MLVALMEEEGNPDTGITNRLDIVDLRDPATGALRSYLVDPTTHAIHELTAVKCTSARDDLHQSFAVGGQYVVKNGTLHVITSVDPLFWFLLDDRLPKSTGTGSLTDQQWQPLSQVLSQFDPKLVRCLRGPSLGTSDTALSKPLQLQHLYAEMSLGDTDTYVKFSIPLALTWLERKHHSIAEILYRQLEKEESRNARHRIANGRRGGASAPGFTVPSSSPHTDENEINVAPKPAHDDEDNHNDNSNTKTQQQRKEITTQRNDALFERAKETSIQIVCNYLSESWRLCFLQHLHLDPSAVLESVPSKKNRLSSTDTPRSETTATGATVSSMPLPNVATADWNAIVTGIGTTTSRSAATKAPAIKPSTAGAKRLLKGNTTGLQKMSSFFRAGKKPK